MFFCHRFTFMGNMVGSLVDSHDALRVAIVRKDGLTPIVGEVAKLIPHFLPPPSLLEPWQVAAVHEANKKPHTGATLVKESALTRMRTFKCRRLPRARPGVSRRV